MGRGNFGRAGRDLAIWIANRSVGGLPDLSAQNWAIHQTLLHSRRLVAGSASLQATRLLAGSIFHAAHTDHHAVVFWRRTICTKRPRP